MASKALPCWKKRHRSFRVSRELLVGSNPTIDSKVVPHRAFHGGHALDSLGHFLLEASLATSQTVRFAQRGLSVSASFDLDTSDLPRLYGWAVEFFKPV